MSKSGDSEDIAGFYLYLAFQNVHAAGGSDAIPLQAPCSTVDKFYGNQVT